MRRLGVVLVILLFAATGAFAQDLDVSELEIMSLRSFVSGGAARVLGAPGVTGGLFDNELGAASSVIEDTRGPGFSDLDANYIFGGIGNLSLDRISASTPFLSDFDNPLLFGLYRDGDMPWSYFTGLHIEGTRAVETQRDYSETTDTVDDNDDSTAYEWIDNVTETRIVIPEYFLTQHQFITRLNGMNAGLELAISRRNDAMDDIDMENDPFELFNRVTIEEEAYDDDDFDPIAADTPPSPFLNVTSSYELNTGGLIDLVNDPGDDRLGRLVIDAFDADDFDPVADDLDDEDLLGAAPVNTVLNDFQPNVFSGVIGVPLFLDDTHYFRPSFRYSRTDRGFRESYDFTLETGDPDIARQSGEHELINVTNAFGLQVDYAMLRDPIFGDNDRNQLRLDASLMAELDTRSRSFEGTETAFDAVGDDFEETGTDSLSITSSQQPALNFGVSAGASHSFYFTPAENFDFALAPSAQLSFASEVPGGARPTEIVTDRQVLDGDGDNVSRTETTETIEYAARGRTNTISGSVQLPITLSGQPEDWLFGFTISSVPGFVWTRTAENTYDQERSLSTLEETTTTGDDDPETEVTETRYAERERSSEVTNSWSIGAVHQLGLNTSFGENVDFDIMLTGTNTILAFNRLVIQATIAY